MKRTEEELFDLSLRLKMHAKKSGSVDFVVETEVEEAAELLKQLLSYLPDIFEGKPVKIEGRAPVGNPDENDRIIPLDPGTRIAIVLTLNS